MTTSIGFGLTFSIEEQPPVGVYNAIATVIDADFPEIRKILSDITAHDSPQGYMEKQDSGMRELATFNVVLGWDDTDAQHVELVSAFGRTTPTNFEIQSPDASETIRFAAHVEVMGRVSQKDQYYQMNMTFAPTGAPTIT